MNHLLQLLQIMELLLILGLASHHSKSHAHGRWSGTHTNANVSASSMSSAYNHSISISTNANACVLPICLANTAKHGTLRPASVDVFMHKNVHPTSTGTGINVTANARTCSRVPLDTTGTITNARVFANLNTAQQDSTGTQNIVNVYATNRNVNQTKFGTKTSANVCANRSLTAHQTCTGILILVSAVASRYRTVQPISTGTLTSANASVEMTSPNAPQELSGIHRLVNVWVAQLKAIALR